MKHGVLMHDVLRFEKLLADLKNLDEDIKDEVKALISLVVRGMRNQTHQIITEK